MDYALILLSSICQ